MRDEKGRKKFLPMKRMAPAMLISMIVMAAILSGSASGLAFGDRKEDTVRELVSRRTDAMSGYFSSKLSYWEAGRQLRKMEEGRLLEEDLKNMREYFRTDIEQVREYEILNVNFTMKEEDILCATVEIQWETEGLDGVDCFTEFYSVICERNPEEDEYKLVHFF